MTDRPRLARHTTVEACEATLIGASANVVLANLSDRAGQAIPCSAFLPHGVLVVFESLAIATIYVWLRYLA